MTDADLDRLSYQIWLGNTLVLNWRLNFSLPTVVFFSIASIMFILIMSVALMAWPSRNSDTVSYSYSYSYAEATSIAACCHFWGHADPWFFRFSASSWVEYSIVPFEISIASSLCWASFHSTVRSTQGNKSSQPCCSSQPMIAPDSFQFVCI